MDTGKVAKITICGEERHERIRQSYALFRDMTDRVGEMPIDALILGNCRACGSTIAVPMAMREQWYKAQAETP